MTTSYSLNESPIGVIGAGKLGTTLALSLSARGAPIRWVASRKSASSEALRARLDSAEATSAEALCERATVVLLTTPDDALGALAAQLPFRAGQAVVHCSGALDTNVLARARAAGADTGCLHPIQTFPERFGGAELFAGTSIGIEAGDGALHAWLRQVCAALGSVPIELEGVDRARYHAAAVLASNYVVALHQAAARAFELAGLPADSARGALAPLTLGAARAIERLPLDAALTGPVARGDAATVERHLEALRDDPALHALYLALGARLLELPLSVPAGDREKLRALLGATGDDR